MFEIRNTWLRGLVGLATVVLTACSSMGSGPAATRYAVDPYWPKTLPDKWQIGAVAGVAVDKRDHVWIIHRPGSFTDDEKAATFDPPRAACCVPAPSVIE
ncbi:MAG: repeat containing protein, partial [Variovorax sp.]|nr:repeat containing protein [Variovorax sp.]